MRALPSDTSQCPLPLPEVLRAMLAVGCVYRRAAGQNPDDRYPHARLQILEGARMSFRSSPGILDQPDQVMIECDACGLHFGARDTGPNAFTEIGHAARAAGWQLDQSLRGFDYCQECK